MIVPDAASAPVGEVDSTAVKPTAEVQWRTSSPRWPSGVQDYKATSPVQAYKATTERIELSVTSNVASSTSFDLNTGPLGVMGDDRLGLELEDENFEKAIRESALEATILVRDRVRAWVRAKIRARIRARARL